VPVLSLTLTTSSSFPLGPFLIMVVLFIEELDGFRSCLSRRLLAFIILKLFPVLQPFCTGSVSILACLRRLRCARAEVAFFIAEEDASDIDGEGGTMVSCENVTERDFFFGSA